MPFSRRVLEEIESCYVEIRTLVEVAVAHRSILVPTLCMCDKW